MENRVQHILELIKDFSDEEMVLLKREINMIKNSTTEIERKKSNTCPNCGSLAVKKHGKYKTGHRFKCQSCTKTYNNNTRTPLSGIHFSQKMSDFATDMSSGGTSLRKISDSLGISLKTAFDWRHKILKGYSKSPSQKLKGLAEADETFFLYSEKGNRAVSDRRPPRKRGGKANKRGISNEQVPVIFGCDRNGEMLIGVGKRGRISLKDIEKVLAGRIETGTIFCTDSHSSFKAFAKAYKLQYQPVNISSGHRVVKKVYHIQHVNSAHTQMKKWINRFQGVSTKYLDNYMKWFSLMEEVKLSENQETQFIQKSVHQVIK